MTAFAPRGHCGIGQAGELVDARQAQQGGQGGAPTQTAEQIEHHIHTSEVLVVTASKAMDLAGNGVWAHLEQLEHHRVLDRQYLIAKLPVTGPPLGYAAAAETTRTVIEYPAAPHVLRI